MIHAFLWCVSFIFFLVVGFYVLALAIEMLKSQIGSFFLALLTGAGGVFIPIPWIQGVCFVVAGVAALRWVCGNLMFGWKILSDPEARKAWRIEQATGRLNTIRFRLADCANDKERQLLLAERARLEAVLVKITGQPERAQPPQPTQP